MAEHIDQGIFNGTFALFAGKAYAIFALLFGFTFYIQTSNQKNKRERLWLSFSMADGSISRFCHTECDFFPAGDVLLLFAVVSIVLFLTRNWSDKAILILAVVFLLQPIEWYHFIASVLNPSHQLPDLKGVSGFSRLARKIS